MTEPVTEQASTLEVHRTHEVRITVHYLPAERSFHHEYLPDTTVGTVQAEAMQFFGVRDHKDRDEHRFFLEYHGRKLTNASETLRQLLGERHEAEFHLVEQITPGGASK